MAKRSIWKAKHDKVKAELDLVRNQNDLARREVDRLRSDANGKSEVIAGLCDAMRATAEQLEVRDIWDTARHLRRIADNYSPAALTVRGEAIKR
jgi:hypothetical protein